jgi:hypothetical protein
MSTLSKHLKDWNEQDLKDLIQDRIEESTRLEYKREVDLSEKGKKEACKDVSAFANGQGGVIIYAIEEEGRKDLGSIPKRIKPLTDASIKETLENVLLNGVCPKMTFWIYPIQVKGGHCLIVHIPQSQSTHMVTLGKDNRYYIRRNFQSSPMTEQEVQAHYSQTSQAKEETDRQYYSERTKIEWEEPTIQLVTIPLVKQSRLVDPRKFSPKTFAEDAKGFLDTGLSWLYKLSGNEYAATDITDDWSKIAFSGICEHIDRPSLRSDGVKRFFSKDLLGDLHDLLLHYGRVYATVGYYGPVKVYYRLANTKNGVLDLMDRPPSRDRHRATKDEFLHDPDTFGENLLFDRLPIVHEIMDLVWIFFGFEGGCRFFNEDSTLKDDWKRL